MKKSKFIISLLVASILLIVQAGAAFAAPTLEDATTITGILQKIELKSDSHTGITVVWVTLSDGNNALQSLRISVESAMLPELGLVTLDGDGNPVIVDEIDDLLGQPIEIDPSLVIPTEEKHPVGSALSIFFSDISDLDYDLIMVAHHEDGFGFGVIAQALWLIRKMDGNADDFMLLLQAKKDGDFSDFALEDGTIPTTWGQLRKAAAGDNLGTVMSHKDKENNGSNGNASNENSNKNKDKNKDKAQDKDKGNPDKGNSNENKP